MTTKQSTATRRLEKFIGRRCKTKDIHDFPELEYDGRCSVCELYEIVDALIAEARADELKALKRERRKGERSRYYDYWLNNNGNGGEVNVMSYVEDRLAQLRPTQPQGIEDKTKQKSA